MNRDFETGEVSRRLSATFSGVRRPAASRGGPRTFVAPLAHHFKPHPRHAGASHAQSRGGCCGDVDDAPSGKWPAIDDGDDDAATCVEIVDPHMCAERQSRMRADQTKMRRIGIVSSKAKFIGR